VAISKATKEMVWSLHEIDKCPKTEIAKRVGISRQKVYDILADETNKNRHLQDTVKDIREEYTKSLIDLLRNDNRLPNIVNKILDGIDDINVIERMIAKDDLKPLMTVVGVLSDKTIATKRLAIEERRIATQEKSVQLKEQELELRTSNPEAFQQDIVIVNDIEDAKDYYKKDNKGKYATN
jgi:hypothetical protein